MQTPSQVVILAAGESSRFIPFNQTLDHKSLFKLNDKPIINYTIESVIKSGIQQIIIIKSPQNQQIMEATKKYADKIIYLDQIEPKGMGDAILLAKPYLNNNSFLVINPQQINFYEQVQLLNSVNQVSNDTVFIYGQKTNNPQKYGVMVTENNQVTKIIEKPQEPITSDHYRIVGIYMLNQNFIKVLESTPSEEYQFELALDRYITNFGIQTIPTNLNCFSLKYAWDLFSFSEYLTTNLQPNIDPSAKIHPSAIIDGDVIIKANTQIHEYAIIHGPCIIGENVVIGSYCKVRDHVILENSVQIENQVEVTRTIISQNSHIHSGFIGDSLIGTNCRIGAGFITANKRLDRHNIHITIKNQKIDTQLNRLGVIMGDMVKIGIHSGTNPGRLVASHTIIPPNTII